jgi:hypothetical protein
MRLQARSVATDRGWKMKNIKDQKLADAIGNEIALWYHQNSEIAKLNNDLKLFFQF